MMKELWELCRKLSNPERLELLRKTYAMKKIGMGVNEAVENTGLGQSAVSQYFKQLLELGIVRRERGGRLVGYYADWSNAPSGIAEIAKMLFARFSNGVRDVGFLDDFAVFGNAFRLRAIRYIAANGPQSKLQLAEKYDKQIRFITRDLEPAVKGGVLDLDSEDQLGVYTYIPSRDPIARRVVEVNE